MQIRLLSIRRLSLTRFPFSFLWTAIPPSLAYSTSHAGSWTNSSTVRLQANYIPWIFFLHYFWLISGPSSAEPRIIPILPSKTQKPILGTSEPTVAHSFPFLFSFPSSLSLLLRLDLAPIPDIMSLFCLPMSSVCIFFFTNMRDDWNGEMPN